MSGGVEKRTSTTCVNLFQVSKINFVSLFNEVSANSRIRFNACNQRTQVNNINIDYIQ